MIFEVSRAFRHGRSVFFAATQIPSEKQLLYLTHILAGVKYALLGVGPNAVQVVI